MQRNGTAVGSVRINRGKLVVTLETPPARAVLEAWIYDQVVGAPVRRHLDVVDQTFPISGEHDFQGVWSCGAISVCDQPGVRDIRPTALGRFIAVRPVRGQPIVGARID